MQTPLMASFLKAKNSKLANSSHGSIHIALTNRCDSGVKIALHGTSLLVSNIW